MGLFILKDVIENITLFGGSVLVLVPRNEEEVDANTQVLLIRLDEDTIDFRKDPRTEGFRYYLEIPIIEEVLDGLKSDMPYPPTIEQQVKAVNFYVENDAYPDIDDIIGAA